MQKDSPDFALYARFLDFKPRKGDLRKIEILDAAIDCLAEDGLHHLTFENVGKKLGIGRAHVAYHFPEMEELIEAVVKLCVSHVQSITVDAVTAEETPVGKLDAFINGTFEWVHSHPKQASVILLLYYLASIDRQFKKIHDEVRTLGAKRLEVILQDAVLKKNRAQAGAYAKQVQSLLTGHIVDFLTTQPKESLENLRRKTLKEVHDLCGIPNSKI